MPIPFLFYKYGERLRKHSRYAPTDMGKKGGSDEESADGVVEDDKEE
jgi:DHA1 family multidrug resistance protein-like MFS transporter